MPRQIGWSQESNLLYDILMQLDRLLTVAGGGGGLVVLPTFAAFPPVGDEKLIYLAQDTNKIYYWDINTLTYVEMSPGLTSVGLTMPSAFTVTNSPLTSNGTIAVTGAGVVSQYVRGDGSLADFPGSTGGGSSVNYYLNGGTNQGTFGGNTYYQMSKAADTGPSANFNIAADGYIAQFITDAGDPSLLQIPAGAWNVQMYMNANSAGGTPNFYLELYKYDGASFSLIASNSANPEFITGGTSVDLYYTSISVPATVLTLTDRLALRVYVVVSGKTITLHTQDDNLALIVTTFTSGMTALNGLTSQVQFLATGTAGTDFTITSSGATHTFDLPIASATNTGKLSSGDWNTFNTRAVEILGAGTNSTVRCGVSNVASGACSAALAGCGNTASACYSSVLSGKKNITSGAFSAALNGICNSALCDVSLTLSGAYNVASSYNSTVANGGGNTSSGYGTFVGNGSSNTASNSYSTVLNGLRNTASGNYSYSHGACNTASSAKSTVINGLCNTSSNVYASVVNGFCNTASGSFSLVNGESNQATSDYSLVGNGFLNCSTQGYATIVNGTRNVASISASFIGNGICNAASASYATVVNGENNTASGCSTIIGNGRKNTLQGHFSFIGSGVCNNICNLTSACLAVGSVVVGGIGNNTTGGTWSIASCTFTSAPTILDTGRYSFIGGGFQNQASCNNSVVVGGQVNTAGGNCAFVGGGFLNAAYGNLSTIVNGQQNSIGATGQYGTIVGGVGNTTNAVGGFVGSGLCNFACNAGSGCLSAGAVVVGGVGNNTTGGTWSLASCSFTVAPTICNAGQYSFVGGGFQNQATGCYSGVLGGQCNVASGAYSGAFGCNLTASAACTFYTNNQCVCGTAKFAGQVEVNTTTGALLQPRLTTAQRNALTPVAGMTIFNTDTAALEVYNGSAWQNPVAYVNTAANLFNYYNFI